MKKANPIYKLLQKDCEFCWMQEHSMAFETLEDKWNNELELRMPDMNKEFVLEADASDIGLSAVLKQGKRF